MEAQVPIWMIGRPHSTFILLTNLQIRQDPGGTAWVTRRPENLKDHSHTWWAVGTGCQVTPLLQWPFLLEVGLPHSIVAAIQEMRC